MDLSSIKRNIQNTFSNSALKTKTFAGVTTASHGPSPSTGDNNNNDHTPDFCQFSNTTAPFYLSRQKLRHKAHNS